MPFYLKHKEVLSELKQFKSVLIIPCGFCSAASMAIEKNEPYFEFFKRFTKTGAFENYIRSLRKNLEKEGLRTDIFTSNFWNKNVVCMWSVKRRKRLMKLAEQFEAILVLGCESAVVNVRNTVKELNVKVIKGMVEEGLMIVKPKYYFPDKVVIELDNVTPVNFASKE